jgi:hypothetical protein
MISQSQHALTIAMPNVSIMSYGVGFVSRGARSPSQALKLSTYGRRRTLTMSLDSQQSLDYQVMIGLYGACPLTTYKVEAPYSHNPLLFSLSQNGQLRTSK